MIGAFQLGFSDGPSIIPRPLLSEILQARLSGSCTVHNSKKLSRFDVSENGPITLHFQDGTSAQTDTLIGADGVNSATRASFFQHLADGTDDAALQKEYASCIPPRFSGQLAYRCMASVEKIKAENPEHPSFQFSNIVRLQHCISHRAQSLNVSQWCGKDQACSSNRYEAQIF